MTLVQDKKPNKNAPFHNNPPLVKILSAAFCKWVTTNQKLFSSTPSSPYREFLKPVVRFKTPQCYFWSGSGEVLLALGHFYF